MTERSTKRQQELLQYVDEFIRQHGYGPSYREVMNGLGYKSVSTVAVHIDGLIAKGYLRKRDNSARSLEVVSAEYGAGAGVGGGGAAAGGAGIGAGGAKEKWLVAAIETRFNQYEKTPSQTLVDELYVLIGALKVLGFSGAYDAMRVKLGERVKRG